MTNYANGAAFERKVGGLLAEDGYVVYRSGGSHGAADLIGLKPGQVLLVQAKTDGRLDPAPWNELYDQAEQVGAVPLLAHRPAPGRVEYRRLTGRKEKAGRAPYEVWSPDEVAA